MTRFVQRQLSMAVHNRIFRYFGYPGVRVRLWRLADILRKVGANMCRSGAAASLPRKFCISIGTDRFPVDLYVICHEQITYKFFQLSTVPKWGGFFMPADTVSDSSAPAFYPPTTGVPPGFA